MVKINKKINVVDQGYRTSHCLHAIDSIVYVPLKVPAPQRQRGQEKPRIGKNRIRAQRLLFPQKRKQSSYNIKKERWPRCL